MKIAVNGRFLLKPFTGIGQYTRNLLWKLAELSKDDDFYVVLHKNLENGGSWPKNVHFIVKPEWKLPLAGLRKPVWEQIQFVKALSLVGADIAFIPYPAGPWCKFLYGKKMKYIVTVHDAIPWKLKEYQKGILSALYLYFVKRSLPYSDKILTISNASKNDLLKYCGVLKEKVEVVYNGVSEFFSKASSETSEEKFGASSGEILGKFGLEKDKYLIYVGGYDKRKNVRPMIEAYNRYFERATESGAKGMKILLVGGVTVEGKNNLIERPENISKGVDGVVCSGFLDEASLADLYRNSFAFINLSSEEGFNLPALEAFRAGTRLLLSDIPVHREIFGDVAVFVKENQGNFELGEAIEVSRCFERKRGGVLEGCFWVVAGGKVKEVIENFGHDRL